MREINGGVQELKSGEEGEKMRQVEGGLMG